MRYFPIAHYSDALFHSSGVEWKTFNAAQKQARRDMMPLYETKRPLLAGRINVTASHHTFAPMFFVQV